MYDVDEMRPPVKDASQCKHDCAQHLCTGFVQLCADVDYNHSQRLASDHLLVAHMPTSFIFPEIELEHTMSSWGSW